jgi:hypothetical protein
MFKKIHQLSLDIAKVFENEVGIKWFFYYIPAFIVVMIVILGGNKNE